MKIHLLFFLTILYKPFVYSFNTLFRVFCKLHQPAASPAASHPGYSISEDRLRYCRSDGSAQYRNDGDIQALLGSAEFSNHKNYIYNNLQKVSLLSKLIYEYDFNTLNNEKNNYIVNSDFNIPTNLTFDFIQKNNIYFNVIQFITSISDKNFVKKADKYFEMLDKYFPNSQIYGYFCSKNRIHSFILINHKYKEIIVIFRGSQYIEEWFQNLNLFETQFLFNKDFSIHSGIYNMYCNKNINKNMIYILKNLFHYFPDYKTIFSGHSRGGVTSIIFALELLENGKINKKRKYEIYTFGNPPIFNYKIANYLHYHPNIKVYNIFNEYDIISSLPIPYRYQIGTEILLKDNDIFIKEHEEPFKNNFYFNFKNLFVSIVGHDLNLYIKNIFEYSGSQ